MEFTPIKDRGETATSYSAAYIDLLSRTIGVARQRQMRFGELIGDADWNVDFENGVILFGETEFPIGFIGSESLSGNTWMWGSHNINNFPEPLVRDVTAFFGSDTLQKTPEINQDTVPLDDMVNGHNLASILSVAGKNSCYYRCPYEGGAAFVLVKNVPDSVFAPASAQAVVSLIGELILQLPLHHSLLARSLLEANCNEVEEKYGAICGQFADGSQLICTIDDLGRIASMNVSL